MKIHVEYEHERPPQIENPDITPLRDIAKQYMDAVESVETGGYVDEDFKHYMFEAVIETFYGADAWKYINERK